MADGASLSIFQAGLKSVAGSKTCNPRFTIYLDQINQSFTKLELFYVYQNAVEVQGILSQKHGAY